TVAPTASAPGDTPSGPSSPSDSPYRSAAVVTTESSFIEAEIGPAVVCPANANTVLAVDEEETKPWFRNGPRPTFATPNVMPGRAPSTSSAAVALGSDTDANDELPLTTKTAPFPAGAVRSRNAIRRSSDPSPSKLPRRARLRKLRPISVESAEIT